MGMPSPGGHGRDLEALEAQRQADDSLDHETPIEELFEDQLACADMVLLTKTDLLGMGINNGWKIG